MLIEVEVLMVFGAKRDPQVGIVGVTVILHSAGTLDTMGQGATDTSQTKQGQRLSPAKPL